MKKILFLLTIVIAASGLQQAEAQSLRSLIKQKILEDNLEAQAKRDSARAVEEGRKPDPSPNTTLERVYLDALGISGNVDYETEYNYDAFLKMEITGYDKKGKIDEQIYYNTYLAEKRADYAMVFTDGKSSSTIILDAKNAAMLFLAEEDGEKTGFVMNVDEETIEDLTEEYAYDEEEEVEPYAIYRTGKTKRIEGYLCHEYLIRDEEDEAHIWASEQLGKKISKEMLNDQRTFGNVFYHAAMVKGVVLEYDLRDNDSGEQTIMRVTEIDLNRTHKISTYGYEVVGMKF